MSVGTAAMFGVGMLVAQGLMTGSGPEDPDERQLWLRTGRLPYAFKGPDGEWHRYNRFEPIGMLLGMAADMTELGTELFKQGRRGQFELEKIGQLLLGSLMLNLADKTFLRGIGDFMQAYLDPKRYFQRWMSGTIGAVVPNIAAQTARIVDPYMREARGVMQGLQARVPGWRQGLPKKLDIAGEPIERSAFEPSASSTERDDPLAQAMLSLGVFKDVPQRKLTIDGRELELSGKEYESYKGYVQRERWQQLTPMVTSPELQRLMRDDPQYAARTLEGIYQRIGTAAKWQWLDENRGLREKILTTPRTPRAPSNYAEELQ